MSSANEEMPVNEKCFQALERLARSSWGHQGVGMCKSTAIWMQLVHDGLAKPLIGEPKEVLALTLKGFRTLEAMRQKRNL